MLLEVSKVAVVLVHSDPLASCTPFQRLWVLTRYCSIWFHKVFACVQLNNCGGSRRRKICHLPSIISSSLSERRSLTRIKDSLKPFFLNFVQSCHKVYEEGLSLDIKLIPRAEKFTFQRKFRVQRVTQGELDEMGGTEVLRRKLLIIDTPRQIFWRLSVSLCRFSIHSFS
jgi:hypothetical protein